MERTIGCLATVLSFVFMIFLSAGVQSSQQQTRLASNDSLDNQTGCYIYLVGMRLKDRIFSVELFHRNSSVFAEIGRHFENQIMGVTKSLGGAWTANVTYFRPGSVLVYFNLSVPGFPGNSSDIEATLGKIVGGHTNISLDLDPSFLFFFKEYINKSLLCRWRETNLNISGKLFSGTESVLHRLSYTLSVDIELDDCGDEAINGYWSVYKLDGWSVFDLLGNELTDKVLEGYGVYNWTLEAFTLSYGLYCIVYQAKLNESSLEVAMAFGYFDVQETKLQASLVGFVDGGYNLFPWGKNITANASLSRDPDSPSGSSTGIVYYLLCTKYGEAYAYPISNPVLVSQTPSDSDLGGCFQTGPGLVGFNRSVTTFTTRHMTPNVVYTLRLYLSKPGRTLVARSYLFFLLLLLPPEPPLVLTSEPTSSRQETTTTTRATAITQETKTTYQPSTQTKTVTSVQPSSDSVAETTGKHIEGVPRVIIRCIENCAHLVAPTSRLSFTADCQHCNNSRNQIWQLLIKSEGTKNSSAVWQNVENLRNFAGSNITLSSLVILTNKLKPGRAYQVKASVVLSPQSIHRQNISATFSFNTSSLPFGGYCRVSPRSGIALVTMFRFTCTSWQTVHLPLAYTFYYYASNGLKAVLGGGWNSTYHTKLATGAKTNSYHVNISVSISDSPGGTTILNISVKVEPFQSKPSSSIAASMFRFIDGENSELGKSVKNGDIAKSTSLALSVLETINYPSGNNITRLDREKIVDIIVEQIADLTIADVQSSLRVSTVIAAASANHTVFSLGSQEKALEVLKTIAKFLENATGNSIDFKSFRDIRESGKALTISLGNILIASSRRTNNDFKSKSLVTTSLMLIDKVGDVLLSIKLVGEAPTIIKTPFLQLTLTKQAPDAYSGMEIKDDFGEFLLPTSEQLFGPNGKSQDYINAMVLSANFNPYTWISTSQSVNTNLTSLTFKDKTGDRLKVKDLDTGIGITLTQPERTHEAWSKGFVQLTPNNTMLRYHKITITNNGTSALLKLIPDRNDTNFTVFLRRRFKPTLHDYDFTALVPNPLHCDVANSRKSWDCNDEAYHIWLPSNLMIGDYYIGIKAGRKHNSQFLGNVVRRRRRRKRSDCILPDGQIKTSCLQMKYPPTSGLVTKDIKPEYSSLVDCNYSISVEARTCMYYSDEEQQWTSRGCKVKPISRDSRLHCECDHLTCFSGQVLVEPTPLEFGKIFVNFTEIIQTNNIIVLVTIIALLLAYILVIIIVRRLDRADEQTAADKDKWSHSLYPSLSPLHPSSHASVTTSQHHLWISVVSKPPGSSFTRVQRATCCISLLFAAMVTNAMFYQVEGESVKTIQVGPLCFSLRQVMIGIESGLLTFPLGFVIVSLFQYESTSASKKSRIFSHCSQFVAWSLCSLVVLASGTITFFYSMQWGAELSKQWISSMVISFLQDIALIQPGKMVVFSLVGSFFCRRNISCGSDDGQKSINSERTHTKCSTYGNKMENSESCDVLKRRKKHEAAMRAAIKECVLFLFTIVLLMIVVYGNRDHHRYYMVKSLRTCFQSSQKINDSVKTWHWLQTRFLKCLYSDVWYNNVQKANVEFIQNQASFRCGMPRIRQLRVKPDSCSFASANMRRLYNNTCFPPYSADDEDTTACYKPTWNPVPPNLTTTCSQPWRYTSQSSLDTRTFQAISRSYGRGGYIAVLGHEKTVAKQQLRNLERDSWIDRRTRALFVEFILFNPNTDLLLAGKQVFENAAIGGFLPMTSFSPVAIYRPRSSSLYDFHLVCQLLFYGMIIYYLFCICLDIYRGGLCKNSWLWLDVAIVCSACLHVGFHVVKENQTQTLVTKLQENPYHPGTLDHVVFWDWLSDSLLAILVFLSTVKLLKLNIYLPSIRILATTLYLGVKECFYFYVVLGIIFIAFAHLAYILDSNSKYFSSFQDVLTNQLLMSLGGTPSASAFITSHSTLSRVYWSAFQLSMNVIVLNIFACVLNAIHRNSLNALERNREYLEFSNYVMERALGFRAWIWGRATAISRRTDLIKTSTKAKEVNPDISDDLDVSLYQTCESSRGRHFNTLCKQTLGKLSKIDDVLNQIEETNDMMEETVLIAFVELRFGQTSTANTLEKSFFYLDNKTVVK